MNAFEHARDRIGEGMRSLDSLDIDPARYLLAMHPEQWIAIVSDAPFYMVPASGSAQPLTLFGFDVFLDDNLPVDYIALRHEVRV